MKRPNDSDDEQPNAQRQHLSSPLANTNMPPGLPTCDFCLPSQPPLTPRSLDFSDIVVEPPPPAPPLPLPPEPPLCYLCYATAGGRLCTRTTMAFRAFRIDGS